MPTVDKQIVILGAGLAGLTCALELARAGVKPTVLEREAIVGGLARSYSEDGFTYDLGPHRLLIHDADQVAEFQRLLGGELLHKERKSRIFLQGRFFHYPLQVGNAMFSMPPATTARILADYAWARGRGLLRPSADRSFEEWVESRFGRTLYEIFFKQYTEKAWGIPCSRISADWASQRISLLSLWDTLVKSLRKAGNQPRTYASSFYYPAQGGIGALCRAMAQEVESLGGQVLCGQAVTGINRKGQRISQVRAGDQKFACDELISTIPLNDLVKLNPRAVPAPVIQAADSLRFRAIVFVYLFLNRPAIADDHWIYLPEEQFAGNRLSESVNFSINNAPAGKTVLCAEITCDVGDATWNTTDAVLAERVSADLQRMGFADLHPADIVDIRTHRAPEAYPIYDIGYQERVNTVLAYGESLSNFMAIGRNALFRYNNMDHSVEMGRRAAQALLDRQDRKSAAQVATESQYFG